MSAVEASHLQRKADVLRHRHVRIERVGLEHHRDVTLPRGQVGHVAVADDDVARIDGVEPGDRMQQRGLAAAGRAEEHDELAFFDLDSIPLST